MFVPWPGGCWQTHMGIRAHGTFQKRLLLVHAVAGSGKSVMVQQLQFLLAQQLVGSANDHAQAHPQMHLVPLCISVQQLVGLLRRQAKSSGDLVVDYIRAYSAPDDKERQQMLEMAVEMRTAILLVDGIDEATGEIRRQIQEYVVRTRAHSGCRMVATSRPEGIDIDAFWELRSLFAVASLKPLTAEQQQTIAEKQLEGSGQLEKFEAAQSQLDAAQQAFYAEVTSSPVLLSLLIAILYKWDPSQPLPTTLLELYETALRSILKLHLPEAFNHAQAFEMLACIAVYQLVGPGKMNGLVRVFGCHDVCAAFESRCIASVTPTLNKLSCRQWARLWTALEQSPLFRRLAVSSEGTASQLRRWQNDIASNGGEGGAGPGAESRSGDGVKHDCEIEFRHLSFQEFFLAFVLSRDGLSEFWENPESGRGGGGGKQEPMSLLRFQSGVWRNVLRIGGKKLGTVVAPRLTEWEKLTDFFNASGWPSVVECGLVGAMTSLVTIEASMLYGEGSKVGGLFCS